MDILKKAVLLVAILSISVFMAGCAEEAAEEAAPAPTSGEAIESPATEALDELKEKMEETQ